MNSYHKGFIVPLVLIILAVLLGGGAYAYMQKSSTGQPVVIAPTTETTTAQTANWKTYSKYGFQIQYPSDFEVHDTTDSPDDPNGNRNISFQKSGSAVSLYIGVFTIGSKNGIEGVPASCIDFLKGAVTSQVRIAGINFIKSDTSKDFRGDQKASDATEYCISEGITTYILIPRIAFNLNEVHPDVNKNTTLNQMIATFNFTR